jgi:hypothetical protein
MICLQREATDSTQLAQLPTQFAVMSPQATEYTLAFVTQPADVSHLTDR